MRSLHANGQGIRKPPIFSRSWFTYVALLPVFFVLLGYVVYPLISIFKDGFFVDGRFSLDLYRRFFNTSSMTNLEATWNSIYISVLSVITCGIVGVAMAFLLESCGLLHDDPEEVLDCYFRACSIRVDCRDLAHIACTFAGRGRRSPSGERLFPARYAHYVNAVLMTCGMYNGSGDFAVKVGLPAKSGVGGGIMAVSPARMGIGIYSPGLDEKGNSLAGIRLLEQLGRRLSLSIF